MAQPMAISTQGVRHVASFNGAGETVVDMMSAPGNRRRNGPTANHN
jgi:hypothetical protein